MFPGIDTCGVRSVRHCLVFFFNATAATGIYTLSLHDALPISRATRDRRYVRSCACLACWTNALVFVQHAKHAQEDRKSTRLNSSHRCISYAVFCLKKKSTPGRGEAGGVALGLALVGVGRAVRR